MSKSEVVRFLLVFTENIDKNIESIDSREESPGKIPVLHKDHLRDYNLFDIIEELSRGQVSDLLKWITKFNNVFDMCIYRKYDQAKKVLIDLKKGVEALKDDIVEQAISYGDSITGNDDSKNSDNGLFIARGGKCNSIKIEVSGLDSYIPSEGKLDTKPIPKYSKDKKYFISIFRTLFETMINYNNLVSFSSSGCLAETRDALVRIEKAIFTIQSANDINSGEGRFTHYKAKAAITYISDLSESLHDGKIPDVMIYEFGFILQDFLLDASKPLLHHLRIVSKMDTKLLNIWFTACNIMCSLPTKTFSDTSLKNTNRAANMINDLLVDIVTETSDGLYLMDLIRRTHIALSDMLDLHQISPSTLSLKNIGSMIHLLRRRIIDFLLSEKEEEPRG